jgi:osmotically-inducible protein OsmY
MKRLLALVAALLLASISLSACFPLVVGAVGGGALVAADRRTTGAQVDDQAIELKAASRIQELYANNVHVNTTSYNRRVLLTGSVPSETHKERIEQSVKDIENVRTVFNELKVANSASLTERSSDSLLTARVKAALLENAELSVNSFKVTTERSTVYLLGLVTQRESEQAAEIVRAVPSVQRVVRVFEIITEEQRKSGQPVDTGSSAPGSEESAAPASRPAEDTGVTVTPVP